MKMNKEMQMYFALPFLSAPAAGSSNCQEQVVLITVTEEGSREGRQKGDTSFVKRTLETPHRQTRPLRQRDIQKDAFEKTSPFPLQNILKEMPSTDSTQSITSWSLNSLTSGTVGSSGTVKSREIDVYQTDSTIVMDEDLEDWGPLLFGSKKKRLELPFRPCRRTHCYCQFHRRQEGKKATESLQSQSKGACHRRQGSDELHGLWIPVCGDAMENQGQGNTTGDSPKRPLKWMRKSHSEYHLFQGRHGNMDRNNISVARSEMIIPTRPRAVSCDQPKQRPHIFPSLMLNTAKSPVSSPKSRIPQQVPSFHGMSNAGCYPRIQECHEMSSHSFGSTVSRQSMTSISYDPTEKVDDITTSATQCTDNEVSASPMDLSSKEPNRIAASTGAVSKECQDRRQRIRTEDVIDEKGERFESSDQPTKWMIEPHVSDDMSSRTSNPSQRNGDGFTSQINVKGELIVSPTSSEDDTMFSSICPIRSNTCGSFGYISFPEDGFSQSILLRIQSSAIPSYH